MQSRLQAEGHFPEVPILVSEAERSWQPMPHWIGFSIQVGYRWPVTASGQRRIAIVSMPSDSAAAGLIALGVLIRDLGRRTATNVDGHYDAILRYARQYIECCRDCDVRCQPELKLCGYTAEATGLLRDKGGKAYRILSKTKFADQDVVVVSREGGIWTVFKNGAGGDLQIEGEPPPRLTDSLAALPEGAYKQIIDGAQIVPYNLRESYSGLCFAGRVAGEVASREVCGSIRFRCEDVEYGLPALLTIQGWSTSPTVSRMMFFNARTERLDSRVYSASLVIADGDASFLRVLNQPEFQRSDIIGVFHRIIDRDNLELLGNRITHLRQWYVEDLDTLGAAPTPPRGTGILILKRRDP